MKTSERNYDAGESHLDKNEPTKSTKHRLDRIYHVVRADKEENDDDDDLILSMTVMENPPSGG